MLLLQFLSLFERSKDRKMAIYVCTKDGVSQDLQLRHIRKNLHGDCSDSEVPGRKVKS